MKRKNLLCLFLAPLILTSLVLIFVLPNLSSGYLELYDAQDVTTKGALSKICYLRWHGRKTELKIEYVLIPHDPSGMRGGRKWNKTVDDGDTFVLMIPRYWKDAWVEIRYDHRIITVLGTGELKEIPWC